MRSKNWLYTGNFRKTRRNAPKAKNPKTSCPARREKKTGVHDYKHCSTDEVQIISGTMKTSETRNSQDWW